jgi:hypothetical protein
MHNTLTSCYVIVSPFLSCSICLSNKDIYYKLYIIFKLIKNDLNDRIYQRICIFSF